MHEVQLVGGLKATGWIFRKGDEDDSGDNDGEDSFPDVPDDQEIVMYSRHAPVSDDEGNLGEPPPRRRRIGAMCYEAREKLRAAIAEDPEGADRRIAELVAENAEYQQRIDDIQAELVRRGASPVPQSELDEWERQGIIEAVLKRQRDNSVNDTDLDEQRRNNVANDKRHAPVPDDEINLGDPSRRRPRILKTSDSDPSSAGSLCRVEYA